MSRRFALLPFSPGYAFAALRAMTLNGREYAVGEEIDKTGITDRLLLQLYEQRRIAPATVTFEGPAPAYLANGAGMADRIAASLKQDGEEGEALNPDLDAGLAEIEEAVTVAVAEPKPARTGKPVKVAAKPAPAKAKAPPAKKPARKRAA